ncbi:MAG: hypothetical protein H7330_09805 [Hymenobacteraceae bacterium]|nr:hypothetical protein [Hymenobacteraceae bacterium]
MQYQSYYRNHFLALDASLSDDDFMTFVRQTYLNLLADPARAAEAALLKPALDAQEAARQAAGAGGRSGKSATLKQTIREFNQWVRLTNATTVFAKYPLPTMADRIEILPKGATGLYQADHSELLAEATTYVNGLKRFKATLGDDAGEQGDVWLAKLANALGGRGVEVKDTQMASTDLEIAEDESSRVLFRIHGRLIDAYAEDPMKAYAFFPYPDSEGTEATTPLPGL